MIRHTVTLMEKINFRKEHLFSYNFKLMNFQISQNVLFVSPQKNKYIENKALNFSKKLQKASYSTEESTIRSIESFKSNHNSFDNNISKVILKHLTW